MGAVWTGLQDYRIYRIGFPLAKLRVNYGQDYRIKGFTGRIVLN
jgi:hypothetical protein